MTALAVGLVIGLTGWLVAVLRIWLEGEATDGLEDGPVVGLVGWLVFGFGFGLMFWFTGTLRKEPRRLDVRLPNRWEFGDLLVGGLYSTRGWALRGSGDSGGLVGGLADLRK
jgi:hypothetical protein